MMILVKLILLAGLCGQTAAGDKPPASAADPLAEAKAMATEENWSEAVERFQKFLKEHPDDSRASEARFWVGFCLVKLDEPDEAIEALRPFETKLAQDIWADDALLHLGHAYRAKEDRGQALASWQRLVEKYPDSVWRGEALLKIVEVLFHDAEEYAACLPYCEQVVKEVTDPDVTGEARYIGAYCLNALRRFDEADRWESRWLDRGEAQEEAWRRVLGLQRDLIRGQGEAALTALEALDGDFPDLDEGTRLDVLLRAAGVLRKHNQADRARDLLLAELRRPSKRPEDDFNSLLDGLDEAFGPDRRADFLQTLATLAVDAKVPTAVRVAVRDRQVQALREDEQPDRAASLLREALEKETAEFARFKAATALADLLAEDKDDRPGAVRVLEDVLPKLKRRDFAHQVQDELKRHRSPTETAKE